MQTNEEYNMTAKTFARGDKKATAIKIIEENLDKDFFEVANMISVALDLNKYAGRAYYKYMIKHGLISKYQPDETPWKSAKAKTSKQPKTVNIQNLMKKAGMEYAKKKAAKTETVTTVETVSTDEKPATPMIRDFIKKQKAAKAA
jgi:hypothetical protein